MRFIDGALIFFEEKSTDLEQKCRNSFDKNIQLTVDTFEHGKIHFLDIKTVENKANVYYKSTNTGQFINFHSHIHWA